MNTKGISILEIAVGIMLIMIVAVVTGPILIRYIDQSHVAAATSDVVSLRDALHSSLARQDIDDENGDSDLIDDLIKRGYLDKEPDSIPGSEWSLRAVKVGSVSVFYVEIRCSSDLCRERIAALDQNLDNGDGPSTGLVQWT